MLLYRCGIQLHCPRTDCVVDFFLLAVPHDSNVSPLSEVSFRVLLDIAIAVGPLLMAKKA